MTLRRAKVSASSSLIVGQCDEKDVRLVFDALYNYTVSEATRLSGRRSNGSCRWWS